VFVPILQYLTSYKPEVGLMTQKLVEVYNLVLLD
jgi:hypothetical protein